MNEIPTYLLAGQILLLQNIHTTKFTNFTLLLSVLWLVYFIPSSFFPQWKHTDGDTKPDGGSYESKLEAVKI